MSYLSPHVLLLLDRFFIFYSKSCQVCLEYIYLPSKVVLASCQLDIELTAITSWYQNVQLEYLPGFRFLMMTRQSFSGHRLSVDPHARVNFC
jgi:hypothetical protein